jgi:hypothetical protein
MLGRRTRFSPPEDGLNETPGAAGLVVKLLGMAAQQRVRRRFGVFGSRPRDRALRIASSGSRARALARFGSRAPDRASCGFGSRSAEPAAITFDDTFDLERLRLASRVH